MKTRFVALLSLCSALNSFAAQPATLPRLIPAVGEVRWGERMDLAGPGAIVLSAKATPAEQAAARLLAQHADRRFRQSWSVTSDSQAPAGAKLVLYLGQRSSFPELERLCAAQNLSVPEHPEGYVLKVWAEGDRAIGVVAGACGRAVIYGQDTLFQLFSMQEGRLSAQQATIRDWPTIPLRGRPHPHFEYFLKPENFDCMMMSRINFIDLRDGIYAFEPGAKLKHDDLRKIIKDARDRELRVYSVVNCGVPASEHDAVIALFKEFLDLGCDGLWASFDDKGPGEAPVEMVNRVLALGREYKIGGDAIAITPPKGDYQTVDTPFNRKIVAVPGMEGAVWYWTSVPGPEDAAAGEAIGLKVRPSWWHNWPRIRHPSLHAGAGAYVPAFSISVGWNRPNEEELRQMGPYVHAIMPWDGWQAQQHYLVPTLGWWSWRPEKHDTLEVRHRIYDTVFGPGGADTAAAFDEGLRALHRSFQFWTTHTDYAPQCPPRLKSLNDRDRVLAEFRALGEKLAALRQGARASSLLSPELLDREYLSAMEREVQTGLAAAAAPFPEYWYPSHQDAVLRAMYAGNSPEVERLTGAVRQRVLDEVAQVERMLATYGSIDRYATWWRDRAKAGVADWQQLIDKRRADLQRRTEEYSSTIAPPEQLLAGVTDPPVQVGTGVWERHNHLLATVVPQPHETFWGEWIGGIHEHEGRPVTVFALERHLPVNSGTFSELPVSVPVSGRRDRLALLVYLADANKESFGLGRAKWRWAGYRSIYLLWNDRELWKADLGIPRLNGEWFVVPLPELPADMKTLPLRLRVEDYFSAKNNLEIVYVGPIHLIQIDRE